MKNRKLILSPYFCIQLFGEGAGGADGGTGDGGANGQSAEPAALAQPQRKHGKANPLANVQYGKQPDAPAAEETKPSTVNPEERSAAFDTMIKGEYKDLYEAKLRDTISKRLKGNEDTVNRYNELQPIVQQLAQKYGVDAADIKGLAKAIDEDESFYEQEAMDRGISVDQMKEIRRMQRENEALKAEQTRTENQKQADQLYAAWLSESETVKGVYPAFDLNSELENSEFRSLLRSHVPMQTAFEVIHKDEIFPAAMQYAAKQVETKLANSIRAGQSRPSEGALGGRSPVQTKSDVSKLTRADREEIARRVARGERISF